MRPLERAVQRAKNADERCEACCQLAAVLLRDNAGNAPDIELLRRDTAAAEAIAFKGVTAVRSARERVAHALMVLRADDQQRRRSPVVPWPPTRDDRAPRRCACERGQPRESRAGPDGEDPEQHRRTPGLRPRAGRVAVQVGHTQHLSPRDARALHDVAVPLDWRASRSPSACAWRSMRSCTYATSRARSSSKNERMSDVANKLAGRVQGVASGEDTALSFRRVCKSLARRVVRFPFPHARRDQGGRSHAGRSFFSDGRTSP
jgi:hypothetical protein